MGCSLAATTVRQYCRCDGLKKPFIVLTARLLLIQARKYALWHVAKVDLVRRIPPVGQRYQLRTDVADLSNWRGSRVNQHNLQSTPPDKSLTKIFDGRRLEYKLLDLFPHIQHLGWLEVSS